MVCPLKSDCNAVIHSEYSKFLGIRLEILGMIYYSAIALFYFISLFINFNSNILFFLVLILTVSAFLFSIYLTFIQIFNLKQLCTWCLTSAFLCAVIFVSAIFNYPFDFMPILFRYGGLFVALHLFGSAIGLGASTVTDFLFFRFLKDFQISKSESKILSMLSQLIWFAIIVIVITGILIYIPQAQKLNQTPKFLVKAIIVLIIIVNGAFLNLLIAPKLVKISFNEEKSSKVNTIRRISFALGAVSIVSWYSAFLIGTIKNIEFSFSTIFSCYLVIIIAAIVASQFTERYFVKKFQKEQ